MSSMAEFEKCVPVYQYFPSFSTCQVGEDKLARRSRSKAGTLSRVGFAGPKEPDCYSFTFLKL